MLFSLLPALYLFHLSASAMPFERMIDSLPRDVRHIAHDEHHARYVAYRADGSLYGTFPADTTIRGKAKRAVTCSDPQPGDFEKLPGWGKIIKYANNEWGTGTRRIEINPRDYRDRPASVCVQEAPSVIVLDAKPTCVTNRVEAEGGVMGSNLQWINAITQGYHQETSITTTKGILFKMAASLSASFIVPVFSGAAGNGPTVTVTQEWKTTTTETTKVTLDQTHKQEFVLNATAGKRCSATVESTTCFANGRGTVRIEAKGWVWFMYDNPTKGHRKWAVNIDGGLLSLPERSSETDYKAAMKSNSRGSIKGKCS